ncbi:HalD/BesD family halogenase [Streptomyces erythrochromogenes]
MLEYVPHINLLTDLSTKARSAHHRPGDAYLLRSDTTAHRVAPPTRPQVRRTVLNFAYGGPTSSPRNTPSARELYGRNPLARRRSTPAWPRRGAVVPCRAGLPGDGLYAQAERQGRRAGTSCCAALSGSPGTLSSVRQGLRVAPIAHTIHIDL